MPNIWTTLTFTAIFLISLSGCDLPGAKERNFFDKPTSRSEKLASFRQFDVQEQWKIYSFGMHDPDISPLEYSTILAERGKESADYIQLKLESGGDDIDYVAASYVFSHIQKDGHYNICANEDYYKKIMRLSEKIKQRVWSDEYNRELASLCDKHSA